MLVPPGFNSNSRFLQTYKPIDVDPKPKQRNQIIYFFLLFIPICTYAAKYEFFAVGNKGAMGFGVFVLWPLFCIPALAAIMFWPLSVVYGLSHNDGLPAILFVPLLLLAIFLPLLPLPPSETEQHFYDNRAQYEAVVQLARQGPLPKDALFHAVIEKQNPLVVLFNPYNDSYTYVAYAAKREDLDKTDACYYDGGIHSQIGDTWWLCFREWN